MSGCSVHARTLKPSAQAITALESQMDLPFEVYDQVVAEPTEESWRNAIAWARRHDFSHFLALVESLILFSLP